MNRNLIIVATSLTLVFANACALNSAPKAPAAPESWYKLPEQKEQENPQTPQAPAAPESQEFQDAEQVEPASPEFSENVDDILDAQDQALEDERLGTTDPVVVNPPAPVPSFGDPEKPKDWVPWHLAYFLTDLSVSSSGLFGPLAFEGNPAVVIAWKKKLSAPQVQTVASESPADIVITESSSADEINAQVEPAIRAALATGKIKNESRLREELTKTALGFQTVARTLEEQASDDNPWWVSRLRLDLSVAATGKVTPAITVGGDVRLRLEWHRMMPKASAAPQAKTRQLASHHALASIGTGLQDLVGQLSEDLRTIAADAPEMIRTGFFADQFRVGVGITASGKVGLASGSLTTVGQLYFSRKKPKAAPAVEPARPAANGTLALISDSSDSAKLRFADNHRIAYTRVAADETVIYKLDRNKFRKGLKKALKIGGFFTDRASRMNVGKWRISELKTDLDLSLSGTVGLVTLSGLATASVTYKNLNF